MTRPASAVARGRVAAGWLLAGAGTVGLTAALVPLRSGDSPGIEAMLYLSLAVACALVGGRWPALGASFLGVAALNFFFTAPFHTFTVSSGENIAILMLYVVVSVAVAAVVDSAARRRASAAEARAEAGTMAMLNRAILEQRFSVPELLDLVRATVRADGVELLPEEPGPAPGRVAEPTGSGWLVLHGCSPSEAERRVLQAFATQLGVLRQREELATERETARELEAANRTRTALLAAVSHDLRTPLSAVTSAASTLRLAGDRLTDEDREELVATVETGAARLDAIISDLLDMSRLTTGAVEVLRSRVELARVLDAALSVVPDRDWVSVPADLPVVTADAGLLERVLANLLSNAVRHSFRVEVDARDDNHGTVSIRVVDHGPGVPRSQQPRMFEPFQRLWDVPAGRGSGLGLAVARGLIEAQGGSIRAEDTPGGGLTMVVELPEPRSAESPARAAEEPGEP